MGLKNVIDLDTGKKYEFEGSSGGSSKLKLFASSDGWNTLDDLQMCPINKPLEENKLYLIEMSFIRSGESIEEGFPTNYLFLLRTYNKYSYEDGYTWLEDCSTSELMSTTYNEEIYKMNYERLSISFSLKNDLDDFPDMININLNTQDGEYLQEYYHWVSCNVYEIGGFENE